ncbi:sodium-dependent glucose transporter 1-like protein, partial [Leptotrombidium deliense]
MERKLKIMITASIIVLQCLHAMCLTSIFITFLDFTEIVGTTLENITIAITVRNCMICVGSIFGTLIYKHLNRQMVFAFFVALEALVVAIMPHVTSFAIHVGLNVILGFSGGALETDCFVMVAELWKENANPVIQGLTLAMNVAFVITPLFISPFLSQSEVDADASCTEGSNITSTTNVTMHSNLTAIEVAEKQPSRIWLPFAILAAFMFLGAYITVMFECYKIKDEKRKKNSIACEENTEEKVVPKQEVPMSYKVPFLIICCLMTGIFWGFIGIFFQFWIIFVVFSDLRLTKAKGATMISVFSFAIAGGSFLSLIASIKFKPLVMMGVLQTVLIIGNCLLVSSSGPEIIWWIGGFLVALVSGGHYSFIYNLAQEKVGITDVVGSMLIVSAYLIPATGFPILIA